ncbi:tyrosine recombinase XerC [Nostoc sp. JL33]|uniref:site-specific integrase n=1 Tax=Nostoc sp. JL33 TaxID=2815396 RepID=UPI0025EFFA17|nr:tyrosine-type recombinase/integrase [Nostoc sp. JL33]MBN3872286.1 tyrosine-type recombinase/integrase [Nostoc sp. JL33]
MAKAKAGTVGIEKYRGKYRLRLPRAIAEGSNRYISTGVSIDSQEGYKQAQRMAWDIEDEIARCKFNLAKHKATIKSEPIPQLTLVELWQRFSNHKKASVALSTHHKVYEGTWKRLISLVPYQSPDDAEVIKDWIVKHKPANTARQVIIHLCACMDWAVSQGLLNTNRFTGLSKGIKVTKGHNIDPFTTAEMLAILQLFQGSHYENFVHFLFLTGCRTGEAIALQWKQVAPDYSTVTINATYYLELRARKPTKTKKSRVVPCNNQLSQLLQKLTRGQPTDQVFTSLEGCVINNHNFLLYHWRPKITQLIEQGLVERYRPAYNTRHTAITRMLESGLTAAEVARVVGNSPRVITEHYAGVSRAIVLPEF